MTKFNFNRDFGALNLDLTRSLSSYLLDCGNHNSQQAHLEAVPRVLKEVHQSQIPFRPQFTNCDDQGNRLHCLATVQIVKEASFDIISHLFHSVLAVSFIIAIVAIL